MMSSRRAAMRCACALALLLTYVALSSRAFFSFGSGQRPEEQSEEARHAPEVDYYKVLQLEGKREAATEKDIRQQFRRLSRLYHPDVAKTEEDKAKYSQVNRAYEVLSDKRKRKVYDMRGERGLRQLEERDRAKDTPGGGMNPLAQLFGMREDDGLRGADMELEAKVDLAKVFTGGQEVFKISKHKLCRACKGSGADATAAIAQCQRCGGSGVLRQRIRFAPGMIQEVHQKCPACGGEGRRPERVCSVCGGKRVVYGSSTVVLELEPGIAEDHVLKFEMEGEESPDRLPGDVIVHVHTLPHSVFTRRRNQLDLETSLTLTLKEALVGFDRNITHLDGVEQVRVQRRDTVSPYGTVLRLPGKGMPKLHVPSERGDLYVRLHYDMPGRLTEEQRNLVEKLL
ncbi:hypothetical protein JIQ42_02510 [Leishmania sp. Namibia]|uniref:hypothetical protein n=1 Tax=Leishmania sp. Namibia TaxID=2802991 RepID=UPI001B732D54|nr:hypothetical protein JIQ42_02510 [Leishmania sp. Namibia]